MSAEDRDAAYERLHTLSAPAWAQAFDKRCQEYWAVEHEALPLAEITEWFAHAIEQGYQYGRGEVRY